MYGLKDKRFLGNLRFKAPDENYHKDIYGVTKGPGVKLRVWGCIRGHFKGHLIPTIEKSVDRWV